MPEIKDKDLAKQIEKSTLTKDEFEAALKKVCLAKKPQSSPKSSKT